MKREQGRNLGFELARLYRVTPNANVVFMDLLDRSDPLISTGACKILYSIIQHVYETGKLLAKSTNKPSNSKIQVISSASSSSNIDTEHGILLNSLASSFLEKMFSEIRDPKPSLRSVIFADAVALLFQVLCVTLNGGMSYFGLDMKLIEELEEKDEALVETLRNLVPQFVSSILSWYGTSRPLYRPLLREMLRRMTLNSKESLMDLGVLVFGDFLELPIIEAGIEQLPIARYIDALEPLVKAQETSSEFETQWFVKAMHLGLLISKPPAGAFESLIAPHRDRIVSNMCSTFRKSSLKRETVELAVSMLSFVGIGKFDFDAWFWTLLAQVDLSTTFESQEPLVNFFIGLERRKEMRVALLNLLLQSWSKAGSAPPLSTNCRLILLFILRNPKSSPDVFTQLNAYVQKNATLDKIQKLVADSLRSS